MSDELYNDDIVMSDDSFSVEDGSSTISDESTQYDQYQPWNPTTYTDVGTPSITPTPSPTVRNPDNSYSVSIPVKNRCGIGDYTPSVLKAYQDAGAVFYVVYTDDTEDVCDYTEVDRDLLNGEEEYTLEAFEIATATSQYFWQNSSNPQTYGGAGVHVTDVQQDNWKTAVANNFSDYNSLSKPYNNILLNSLGFALRTMLYNLVVISKSAISFYDGNGNNSGNIVAFFGNDRAQIGKSSEKHILITSNGLSCYDSNGDLAPVFGSNIEDIEIQTAKIQNLTAEQLSAATAYVATLTASNVTAQNLAANSAKIQNLTAAQLSAATAYIAALETGNVTAQDIIADHGSFDTVEANAAKVNNLTAEQLSAATAYVSVLTAANVSAQNLLANVAKVSSLTAEQLSAATAYIAALVADNISAANIIADHGDFNTVKANAAKVNDLTAAQLSAATGYIATLLADNLAASDIIADHAEIDSLDTTYAQIDMANVNNAWIENGVVKDGSITNAMINSVSANKLTAGTIDASNITVTNLNASNITTGTINGQRIGAGSLSLDKLADDVYTESEVDNLLATMQSEIDGAIETWTGTAVPTLQNTPASEWTTNTDKDKHIGDVYFVVNSELQQNGYNYRFTKTGSTYSWQLIKDSDVTAALSRLSTAEGKITTFESDISTLQTNTGSLTTRTTSLETRTNTVESSLLDKVDTTDFNDLSDTVDEHTQTLTQHTTAISNKADNSTVTTLSNTVSSVQQTANGNSSKLTQLITTLGTNADGTTKTGDVVQRTSAVEQDLSGFKTTVSNTYATKSTVDGIDTRVSSAETQISQNANAILLKANASDVYSTTATNALLAVKANKDTLTSEINASADTVKINADRVDIAGAAIFTSGRLSEASLNQAYGNQSTALSDIQRIYYQCNDGSTVPATPGTATANWVSDTTGNSDTWTLKRMSYDSQKPYIWTCFQIKNTSGTISYSDVLLDDTTTVIDGGKIITGSITANILQSTVIEAINANVSGTINANKINASGLTIGQSQVTNLTSELTEAKKHTQVIVSTSNIDYVANTCTLTARFYVDGVLQTDSSLKWQWYRDGTVQGGQTTGSTGSLSVTSALGIAHRYACKCTF